MNVDSFIPFGNRSNLFSGMVLSGCALVGDTLPYGTVTSGSLQL